MKVTILGSGGAGGVPMISAGWRDCDPDEPKNRRMRPSALIEDNGIKILIDTSPDFRAQFLNYGVRELHAVLYTHRHADHTHGIDDLREVNRIIKKALPVYTDADTMDKIEERFPYVFRGIEEPNKTSIFRPWLIKNIIEPYKPFFVEGIEITPILQDHGFINSMGFKFGDKLAYCTDVVRMPEESFAMLEDVEVLILGCFSLHEHPTHVHVERGLEWAQRINVKKLIITHMGPRIDYQKLKESLPSYAEPAYDGMIIEP